MKNAQDAWPYPLSGSRLNIASTAHFQSITLLTPLRTDIYFEWQHQNKILTFLKATARDFYRWEKREESVKVSEAKTQN